MIPNRQNQSHGSRRLAVVWRDSIWFPPVLAHARTSSVQPRRPVLWPVQIITDPTVCAARTLTTFDHEN
jgi:hypothetical protein